MSAKERDIEQSLRHARDALIKAEKLMRQGFGDPHTRVEYLLGRVDELYVWFVQTHNTRP